MMIETIEMALTVFSVSALIGIATDALADEYLDTRRFAFILIQWVIVGLAITAGAAFISDIVKLVIFIVAAPGAGRVAGRAIRGFFLTSDLRGIGRHYLGQHGRG